MMNLRYASMLTFIALSVLLLGSIDSKAKVIEENRYVRLSKTTVLEENVSQKKIKKQSYRLAQADDNVPEEKVSSLLSWVGMIVTFALFLFVLMSLFQEETQAQKNKEAIKTEENNTNVNINSSKTTEAKSSVNQSDLLTVSVDPQPESNHELIQKQKTAQVEQTTNIDSAEIEPIVDSDVMGKLTIVTSKTTEIDVVFELIRDLEQNSKPSRINGQKDVRRKAIWELSQTNDFRAVEPLLQTIPKVGSLEKNLILDAITQIAHHNLKTINDVLITSLADENVVVRKNAIQELTRLYQSISLITVHLLQMTNDSDKEVQETAHWALEKFKQISIPTTSEYDENRN